MLSEDFNPVTFATVQLAAHNAEEYLRSHGRIAPDESIEAIELSGGVSNAVIRISRSNGEDFVLKQGRGQLKVVEPWFCSIDRIWREIEVLCICEQLLSANSRRSPLSCETPRLLFEDRQNYVYAMSAAPPTHYVWKRELLAGVARVDVAASCGSLLGALHAKTWHDPDLACRLDDRQFFDDLRLDPYYRQIARVNDDLKPAIELLIDSVLQNRHCLVHGDFSPKNLLVYQDRLMLIDFEVGHYGDPAFDIGFFLSHLMLKAFLHAQYEQSYFDLIALFWRSYNAEILERISQDEAEALGSRSIINFAACALARIDGKSRIDYLIDDTRQNQVRRLCRILFSDPPAHWDDVTRLARKILSDDSDAHIGTQARLI